MQERERESERESEGREGEAVQSWEKTGGGMKELERGSIEGNRGRGERRQRIVRLCACLCVRERA